MSIRRTLPVTALAILVLTGCSPGTVTDKELASGLEHMEAPDRDNPESIEGPAFCDSFQEKYGSYTEAVAHLGDISAQEGTGETEEQDVIDALSAQQDAVKDTSEYLAQHTIEGDDSFVPVRDAVLDEYESVVTANNDAIDAADVSGLGPVLDSWGEASQVIALGCDS